MPIKPLNKPGAQNHSADGELSFVYGCKILLVDDEPVTTDILSAMFEPLGFYTFAVNNSLMVLDALEEFEPDLILLDVNMPGQSGFEISRQLKSSPVYHHIPIILLTAMDDQEAIVQGLSYGVQDYVTKPFHKAELTARIINNLRLKKQQDFWRLNQKIIHDQFDPKGLPLKSTFCQYLEKTVAGNANPLTLAIFSVYAINEIVASLKVKDAKDIIESAIFERLHSNTEINAFSGSLDDGKFGIIFLNVPDRLEYLLKSLQLSLEKMLLIGDSKIKLKVNVGYYQSRCIKEGWRDILEKAEIALLEASKPETPSLTPYHPERQDEFNEKWWIYDNLQEAITNDALDVHYQPQFNLNTMQCCGYEALARWQSLQDGFISPDKFIPISEQYGLITPLSQRIFNQSLQEFSLLPAPKIAINISPMQLRESDLPGLLQDLLHKHQLEIAQVELELTESTMMDQQITAVVEHLMKLGFNIAIDDFGTGYSNLSLLTQLPFSKVKIDRSLINEIHCCEKTEALVSSIVSFSKRIGFVVLAEGVETPDQADTLKALGVDEVQGYLYGKPSPLSAIRQAIKH
ncbi:EAL domain-containing protein [Planctobacterium marinum]|uniref:EAL domain-containing protein n=1 Tax=Planctobacterium marinum TaxID=1631968 RepID=UPI001E2E576F|nr:EAL domain-containing response regulator [Planctobacterium marinum]MCC2605447.1 EAL domain-containing response regulator [Planctobacterium marinum]